MKKVVLFLLIATVIGFSDCKKSNTNTDGNYTFTIKYYPDGGQEWGESGTAVVTADGKTLTINITMTTGEKYTRTCKVDGSEVTLKGSYTQPVASNPNVNEVVTYDGTGTFDGVTLNATGTYTFAIPDWNTNEQGTFELTAKKK